MLQVSQIREQYDQSLEALAKRGFDAREVFQRVLKLDEQRRATQAQLDETLAQSNTFSKEIGQLFQKGEPQKANLLKEKTIQHLWRRHWRQQWQTTCAKGEETRGLPYGKTERF